MSVSDIITAWSDVWSNANIQAFTDKVCAYKATDGSEYEIENIFYQDEVNYFELIITPAISQLEIGANTTAIKHYDTVVRYTREKDASGDNYQAVVSAFETLITTVNAVLGNTWSNTVDFYTHQSDAPTVAEITIADRDCWRIEYKFQATLTESL